jgi:hypothetical protein
MSPATKIGSKEITQFLDEQIVDPLASLCEELPGVEGHLLESNFREMFD